MSRRLWRQLYQSTENDCEFRIKVDRWGHFLAPVQCRVYAAAEEEEQEQEQEKRPTKKMQKKKNKKNKKKKNEK